MKALYWFRNDLRLYDNLTLSKCCLNEETVTFVVADTASRSRASEKRLQFYNESIEDLNSSLERENQQLHVTTLRFPQVLEFFLAANQIDALYFSKECASEEREEEKKVLEICEKRQVKVFSYNQSTLISIQDLPFELKNMPFVFTSFRKKLEENLTILQPTEKPKKWPTQIFPLNGIENLKLIPLKESSISSLKFRGGETYGLKRIQEYIWGTQSVHHYKETRNGMLNFNDSTKFSPWLNLGCITARQIMKEVKDFESEVVANESTYWVLFELLWRDYFKFFSLKFGNLIFDLQGVNQERKYTCTDNFELFEKWSHGKTGVSFIDANMNELNKTGWMSNRGRQNVASFLVHQLNLPWTWGAHYFEKMLIDYDPDVNWGNWLYLSGQGSDPRARQFNIERQTAMYDPDGVYMKKWSSSNQE